ncbi:MAG: sterol transfer family [Actinomycetota bacterium]|nr:sterol transfer family [Actinomycetota bacterium]
MRLDYVVSGGPDGEARFDVDAPGNGSLTLLVTHDDWARITSGALDPVVAYMQGKLKITGDMAGFLDLLPVIPLPE